MTDFPVTVGYLEYLIRSSSTNSKKSKELFAMADELNKQHSLNLVHFDCMKEEHEETVVASEPEEYRKDRCSFTIRTRKDNLIHIKHCGTLVLGMKNEYCFTHENARCYICENRARTHCEYCGADFCNNPDCLSMHDKDCHTLEDYENNRR